MSTIEAAAREMFADDLRAKIQEDGGVYLLHTGLGVAGRAIIVHEPGSFTDANGQKIQAPVVQFDDRNVFIAEPANFQILTEQEAATFAAALGLFQAAQRSTFYFMAAADVEVDRARALVMAVLSTMMRELARDATLGPEEVPGEEPGQGVDRAVGGVPSGDGG